MRLHSLRFCGIGPFAGEFDIDFAALSESGLFLLEGPTGSGKSTIIDAIVFALYGQPAAARTKGDPMRSDYIADGAPAWVELVFEIQGQKYRVHRTPGYVGTKSDGSPVNRNPKAVLAVLGSEQAVEGTVIAEQVSAVSSELKKILTLDRDQFTQVVVLPQGEFARFLRADADTRQVVLEKIFGTQLYADITKRLEVARRQANAQRSDAHTAITSALGGFTSVSKLPEEIGKGLNELSVDAEALIEAVEAIVVDRLDAAARLESQRASLAASLADALAAENVATQAFERQERVTALRLELAALELAAPDVVRDRTELEEATKAAAVAATVGNSVAAADRLAAVTSELAVVVERLDRVDRALPAQSWADQLSEAQALATSLEVWAAEEAGLQGRQDDLAALELRVAELEFALHELDTEIAALPNARADLDLAVSQARLLAARQGDLEKSQEQLTHRVTAAAECVRVGAELERNRANALTAVAEAKRLDEVASALRRRYIASMAAVLASELDPGTPCPVCGSVEHPHLAVPSSSHASSGDVEHAETTATAARNSAEDLTSKVTDLQSEVSALLATADGDLDQLQSELAKVGVEIADALAAATEVNALQGAQARLEARANELTKEQSKVTSDLSAQRTRRTAAQESLALTASGLAEQRGEFSSVAARRTWLLGRTVALKSAIDKATEVQAATHDRARREAELGKALSDAGLADLSAFDAANRTDARRSELRTRITDHDEAVLRTQSQLAAPELASVNLEERIDVATPAGARLAIQTRHDDAAAQAAQAAQTAVQVTTSRAALIEALEVSARIRAATAATIRMANMAAGLTPENPKRIALQAFVLRDRFRRVIDAANDRLRVLSDGRFLLEHSEQRSGNAAAGLGLLVRDLETNSVRVPQSLSGGETFYTSLALALGLADIVMAYAGGIVLETMFIDEGFGSLDDEILDDVLDVLRQLRGNSRTVGVISHVAAMKDAIPARIEVRRAAGIGSTLTVRP